MAGDWLKVEKVTPDKPEIESMAARLDLDPDAVFGKCFRLWRWFDDHTVDGGESVSISRAGINRRVGVDGFAEAMEAVGWLINDGDGVMLPNFERHNPETAKRRSLTAQRVAKHRKLQSCNASVTPNERIKLPRQIVATIKERDGNACVYCGRADGAYGPGETKRDARIALDHVIPLTQGGANHIDNLVCACTVCNSFKTNRTPEEAGLKWPVRNDGSRYGCVTEPLPREEKRREENINPPPSSPPPASNGGDGVLSLAWKGVEEELRRCGVALAPKAAESARDNGCRPDEVINVIAFWRLHTGAWDAGALYTRVAAMRPDEDCSEFWPPKSQKFVAAKTREQTSKRQQSVTADRIEGDERRAADIEATKKREAKFGSRVDAMTRDEISALIREKLPDEADFLLSRLSRSGLAGTVRESIIGYLESVAERPTLVSGGRR